MSRVFPLLPLQTLSFVNQCPHFTVFNVYGIHMCVCVRVRLHVWAHVYACMWRLEVAIICLPQILSLVLPVVVLDAQSV